MADKNITLTDEEQDRLLKLLAGGLVMHLHVINHHGDEMSIADYAIMVDNVRIMQGIADRLDPDFSVQKYHRRWHQDYKEQSH